MEANQSEYAGLTPWALNPTYNLKGVVDGRECGVLA